MSEELTLDLKVLVHNNARKCDQPALMQDIEEIDHRLKVLDAITYVLKRPETFFKLLDKTFKEHKR